MSRWIAAVVSGCLGLLGTRSLLAHHSGHLPQIEAPEKVNAFLREFLAQ